MSDPINTSDTSADTSDTSADTSDTSPSWAPARGDIVRLDDPAADGEPRYALFIAENDVVVLSGVQRYELPLYPAS